MTSSHASAVFQRDDVLSEGNLVWTFNLVNTVLKYRCSLVAYLTMVIIHLKTIVLKKMEYNCINCYFYCYNNYLLHIDHPYILDSFGLPLTTASKAH